MNQWRYSFGILRAHELEAHYLLYKKSKATTLFLPPANEVCEGYVFTGVCPQGGLGLCPGASLSGGLCLSDTSRMVTSGWYVSYWNAFLFS